MKQKTFTIKGTTPMLMHSERLANPFDPNTIALKQLTSKRKKTEQDLLDMAKIEHAGGLYYDERDGVHVPGYNILATLINGGKIRKMGTQVKRAVLVMEDKLPLKYSGPKTPDALFADKQFVDIRSVKVGTSKVARCRPIFPDWELLFTVVYDESAIQESDIVNAIKDAGSMVGLGDYRPRFGRFELVQ